MLLFPDVIIAWCLLFTSNLIRSSDNDDKTMKANAVLRHQIQTKFILFQTQHPGNVGASARALKTMGFDELILVQPKDAKVLNRKKTRDGASGAVDVLEKARVVETLEEALQLPSPQSSLSTSTLTSKSTSYSSNKGNNLNGVNICCATGMPTDMYRSRSPKSYLEPRVFFEGILQPKIAKVATTTINDDDDDDDDDNINNINEKLLQSIMVDVGEGKEGSGTNEISSLLLSLMDEETKHHSISSISFCFGNERYGIQEEDFEKCDVILGIPTNPAFGSLNLASAVQLLAYDWRQAMGGFST